MPITAVQLQKFQNAPTFYHYTEFSFHGGLLLMSIQLVEFYTVWVW
jgi:hypothetical protein